MARDPGVLEAVSLGPTKLSKIVNNVLASQEMDLITDVLRQTKFSVYIDETIATELTKNGCRFWPVIY